MRSWRVSSETDSRTRGDLRCCRNPANVSTVSLNFGRERHLETCKV